MSEKVESGMEVVAWAHPDYCDVITDSPTRTIEWESRGVSPIPLVRQSDADRALQQQHEAHRKTWRQLEQVTGLLREIRSMDSSWLSESMERRVDAALSLQAEPERCTCPSGDGSLRWPCPTHKPAPAQDERVSFDDVHGTVTIFGATYAQDLLKDLGLALPVGELFRLVNRDNGVLTVEHIRPAQTEQQPEQSGLVEALERIKKDTRLDDPLEHYDLVCNALAAYRATRPA